MDDVVETIGFRKIIECCFVVRQPQDANREILALEFRREFVPGESEPVAAVDEFAIARVQYNGTVANDTTPRFNFCGSAFL